MNLKKGIALALTAAALMAFTGCGSNGTTSNGEYKVGVVQLVEHPALDAANKGFVDALKEKGLADKITFDQQNAQADQSNLNSIAQRFVSDRKNLILAIATPAAQSMANATHDIQSWVLLLLIMKQQNLLNLMKNQVVMYLVHLI